jgi:predicted ester cyclase
MTVIDPPRAEASPGLPFTLPPRDPVTRIRQRDARELRGGSGERTQPMRGFEPQYRDIVDYIVRITEEIWVDRAIGRIYDTYDHACTIYGQLGVVRSVEEVIASTVATLNAFPDGEAHHLNVAWSGDEREGFYTSHLGFSRSTNLGRSAYGPATGARVGIRFVADCLSRDNRIFAEWLVRDNGALVRQLGLDPDTVARDLAAQSAREVAVLSPDTRLQGQAPRAGYDGPHDTPEGFARAMFQDLWNLRRLDRLERYYWPEVVAHSGGGRVAQGTRNLGALMLQVMAALPDGVMRVEHVCWSEETDGVILAVRWTLEGSTRRGGVLGDLVPEGRPLSMMGASHLRFEGARIVEEWTVFDEIGVLAAAYRA